MSLPAPINCFAAFLCLILSAGLAVAQDVENVFIATGGIRGPSKEIETGTIHISSDGKRWEPVFTGGLVKDHFTHGTDNMVRALTYGNGRLVAAGNKGIGVLTSTDGRNWKHVAEEPGEGPGGFTIAFDGEKFLIPTASHFHVSTDGLNWETTNMSDQLRERHGVGPWDGVGHVRRVVGQNGVFVFAGGRRFGATADGKTFLHHEILPPGEKRGDYHLLAGNGRFIFLSEEGHQTSTDGVKWEPLVIDSSVPEIVKSQTSGVWTGEAFVVQGKDAVYRSTDGLQWEVIPVESGNPDITTAGNGFLFGNVWQAFRISEDGGKTWTQIEQEIPARQVYFFDGEQMIGSGGG